MSRLGKCVLTTSVSVWLCGIVIPALGLTWNAATDFSYTSNPSGAWSYGYKVASDPTGPMELLTKIIQETSYSNVAGWGDDYMTKIQKNKTASGIDIWYGVRVPANGFYIKPGWGLMACMRWTSPINGKVRITSTYKGTYYGWTSGDVHVVKNGISLFDGYVRGFIGWNESSYVGPYPVQSFTTAVQVSSGDTVDFVLGYGPEDPLTNPNYAEDYVHLDGTIEEVTTALGVVAGTVTANRPGNPPLGTATVKVVGTSTSTPVSSSNGSYSLVLAPGDYTLEVKSPGYVTQTAPVHIDDDVTTPKSFVLDLTKTSWDTAADFVHTSNPNDVWSYGTKSPGNPTGSINYLLNPTQEAGLFGYADGAMTKIYKNVTAEAIHVWYGPYVGPERLFVKPGWNPMATMRWTSPVTGTVYVSALFKAINSTWRSFCDVHVVHNGTSLYGGIIEGFAGCPGFNAYGPLPQQAYNGQVNVQMGDTIDFVVGFGPQELNPANTDDYVDIDGKISIDPLPSVSVDPPNPENWNLSADFSDIYNPNSTWTYGLRSHSDPAGTVTALPESGEESAEVQGWADYLKNAWVYKNVTAAGVMLPNGVWVEPYQVYAKPADTTSTGESTVARWIAPVGGTFYVDAKFSGINAITPAHSDVHVVKNGQPLFDGTVEGFAGGGGYPTSGTSPVQTYTGQVTVVAGDRIDFVVGYGPAGSNGEDSVAILANLTSKDPVETIGSLRAMPDGSYVTIGVAKVVTAASGTFLDGACYIEDEDRAAGIKIVPDIGLPSLALGERIKLSGTLGTDANGERQISVESIGSQVVGDALGALGTKNKTVTTPGADVSGLLVTVWGKVTYVDESVGAYFYVDDGSNLWDGTGNTGLRILTDGGIYTDPISLPSLNSYLAVTGLVARANGGIPVIRPRGGSDVRGF